MIINGNIVYLAEGETVTSSAIALAFDPSSPLSILSKTIDCSATKCTIIFDGTKLIGCTIIGAGTTLVFQKVVQTFAVYSRVVGCVGVETPCCFQGTFYCDCLYPELFGAAGNGHLTIQQGAQDDTKCLQMCLDAAVDSGIYRVRLQPRTYLITDTIYYRGNLQLEGSYFTDNYHSEGSCILANLEEGVTEYKDQNNIVIARYRNNLKFALETDCKYKVNNDVVGRIPVIRSLTDGEVLVYNKGVVDGQTNYDTVISVPPIHIRNIAFKSTNHSFGAIRAFGMINSKIEGVRIQGFRLGFYIYKGWEFEISRVHIRTGLLGLFASNITSGLLNSVQISIDSTAAPIYDENGEQTNPDYVPVPLTLVENQYHEFMRERIMGADFYTMVYGTEDGAADQNGKDIKTTAIFGSRVKATLNSCTMEGFDIGCIGYSIDFVLNLPYVEAIKKSIAYVHKGYVEFNNMIGAQSQTQDYTYIAPEIVTKIVLNGSHPGTFYPTYSQSFNDAEARNKSRYNYKSYVVKNHNKINDALPYSPTTYLDYDVGDTVFVKQFTLLDFEDLYEDPDDETLVTKTKQQQLEEAEDSLTSNWGDYLLHPITFEVAMDRIANDFNYRHVKRIVLQTKVEVNDSLSWYSQIGRLTFERISSSVSLVIRAKQYIECDVVFKNFAIDLYSSLCFALNKQSQEIRIENTQVRFHRNDICVIENTGTLPEGKSLSRSITLYAGARPNVRKYYENDWPSLSFIIVERAGTSLGPGSYTGLPTLFLYDGYDFDEVNMEPQTGHPYVVHYIWDTANSTWITQN